MLVCCPWDQSGGWSYLSGIVGQGTVSSVGLVCFTMLGSPKLGGGWFHFFIFTPTWKNDSIWLIFLKGVETTNQKIIKIVIGGNWGSSDYWGELPPAKKSIPSNWQMMPPKLFLLYWCRSLFHRFHLVFYNSRGLSNPGEGVLSIGHYPGTSYFFLWSYDIQWCSQWCTPSPKPNTSSPWKNEGKGSLFISFWIPLLFI